jgi:Mg2+/Co2+ transporter CorB
MTLGLGITLGAILGLLLASAFFSGSETALTAASAAKMHALEQDGNRRARIVNYLLTVRERFIGAILLGNTLANIAASALATSLFLSLFGEEGVAYATIVMTVIVVLFAEVLPKTYAILHADRAALLPCSRGAFCRCGVGAGRQRHAVPRAAYVAPVRSLDQRRGRGALGA